jgi:hypothetical protein
MVSQNKVLRRAFAFRREAVTDGWENCLIKELHNL